MERGMWVNSWMEGLMEKNEWKVRQKDGQSNG